MKNPLPLLFLITFVLLFVFYYAFDKEKEEMRSDPTLERTNYVAKCTESGFLAQVVRNLKFINLKDFKELK